MQAVIETGGKQYQVAVDDQLEVERLAIDEGESVNLDRVLMLQTEDRITVGTPTVPDAMVVAEVVKHKRGKKLTAFKMKRRKGYQRTIGHRQELSVIKIREINA